MTSAYSGIRWGSGLPRQFQYEHSQSRIGGSLWEYPMRYFENSPVFHADKVQTPLLMINNDEDDAVPWYQGIEFFLALRRCWNDYDQERPLRPFLFGISFRIASAYERKRHGLMTPSRKP